MDKIYAELIKLGAKKLEDVPLKIRENVKALLDDASN
ncbi:CD1375 family protein [Bacillus infantis]